LSGLENPRSGRIRFLTLIWCAFIVRGIFYSAIFPIWEGYDEPFHFAFIQYLVTREALPLPTTPVSREVQASLHVLPLPGTLLRHGYPAPMITHDEFWRLDDRQREQLEQRFRNIPEEWTKEPATEPIRNYEAQQPPLYYALFSVILRCIGVLDLASRILLLRVFGVIVASVSIPFGYLAATKVLRNETSSLGIVTLAAVMPEMMVNISRIANESVSITLYTVLVYVALKIVDGPEHFCHLSLVGLLLGLGLLSKAYFLTALPALVVVLVCCFWRWPQHWTRLAFHSGLMMVIGAVMAGWWYWRAHRLMGSWSGLYSEAAVRRISNWEMLQHVLHVNWLSALISVLLSHIWYGGWSFLRVSNFVYVAFGAVVLLAVCGVAVLLFKLREASASAQEESVHPACFLVLIGFYGFFWLGLAYQVLTLYVSERASASTGWYMYCLIIPELILAYWGLQAVLPNRLHSWIVPILTGAFALLDLYGMHFLLIPYYSGLISHSAIYRGVFSHSTLSLVLPARVQDFIQTGLSGLTNRLLVNKSPFLTSSTIFLLWLMYIVATLYLLASSRKMITARQYSERQNGTLKGRPTL